MEIGRKVLIVGSTALLGWSVYNLRKAYKFKKYLKGARAIDQMNYERTLKEIDEMMRTLKEIDEMMPDARELINVEINAPILN